jgi:hypothetical protein
LNPGLAAYMADALTAELHASNPVGIAIPG